MQFHRHHFYQESRYCYPVVNQVSKPLWGVNMNIGIATGAMSEVTNGPCSEPPRALWGERQHKNIKTNFYYDSRKAPDTWITGGLKLHGHITLKLGTVNSMP